MFNTNQSKHRNKSSSASTMGIVPDRYLPQSKPITVPAHLNHQINTSISSSTNIIEPDTDIDTDADTDHSINTIPLQSQSTRIIPPLINSLLGGELQYNRRTISAIICSIISALIIGFLIYFSLARKCNMGSNLSPLLSYTVNQLKSNNIDYWLDYGTLLGAIRDNSIVPWEFDIDIGVNEESCITIAGLKQQFSSDKQYYLYDRSDYIPQKANKLLGYSGHISTPCIRIYDSSNQYYIDIYWYKRITYSEYQQEQQKSIASNNPNWRLTAPFNDYSAVNGDLLCNEEAWDHNEPGGCKLYNDIYPLSTHLFYGELMSIPAHSNTVLEYMYGPDWLIPRPKGYKAIICSTSRTIWAFIIIILLITTAISLAYIYHSATNNTNSTSNSNIRYTAL